MHFDAKCSVLVRSHFKHSTWTSTHSRGSRLFELLVLEFNKNMSFDFSQFFIFVFNSSCYESLGFSGGKREANRFCCNRFLHMYEKREDTWTETEIPAHGNGRVSDVAIKKGRGWKLRKCFRVVYGNKMQKWAERGRKSYRLRKYNFPSRRNCASLSILGLLLSLFRSPFLPCQKI